VRVRAVAVGDEGGRGGRVRGGDAEDELVAVARVGGGPVGLALVRDGVEAARLRIEVVVEGREDDVGAARVPDELVADVDRGDDRAVADEVPGPGGDRAGQRERGFELGGGDPPAGGSKRRRLGGGGP